MQNEPRPADDSTRARGALRSLVRRLAEEFAERLVAEIDARGLLATLEPRPTQAALPARIRRDDVMLDTVCEQLLAFARRSAEPLAIRTRATELELPRTALAHPLRLLVARGLLVRTGERRGTRYALARTKSKRAPR